MERRVSVAGLLIHRDTTGEQELHQLRYARSHRHMEGCGEESSQRNRTRRCNYKNRYRKETEMVRVKPEALRTLRSAPASTSSCAMWKSCCLIAQCNAVSPSCGRVSAHSAQTQRLV